MHVVVDACSSRTMVDRYNFCMNHMKDFKCLLTNFFLRKYALKAIEKMGANLITTESVIFGFAPDSGLPVFKELQKLLREPSADTGL